MLQLDRRVLASYVLKRPAPVKSRLSSGLVFVPLEQKLYKISRLLTQVRRQLFYHLFERLHDLILLLEELLYVLSSLLRLQTGLQLNDTMLLA